MIFIIATSFILFKGDKVESTLKGIIRKAYIQHRGAVNTGGICYKLLPDEFYVSFRDVGVKDFLKMLGKGWFHIMLEPLPNMIQSKAMLFGCFQMLLWYFLLPFAILGVTISARYRLKESLILIIYFLVMTSALAVTGGNIGTIFRLRDFNTPIVLIFSSVGLVNTFNTLKKSATLSLNRENALE